MRLGSHEVPSCKSDCPNVEHILCAKGDQALERVRQCRTGGAVWALEDRVKGEGIEQALLPGGSPATPDDWRKRFDTLMNERCKGKGATKGRFVIE